MLPSGVLFYKKFTHTYWYTVDALDTLFICLKCARTFFTNLFYVSFPYFQLRITVTLTL